MGIIKLCVYLSTKAKSMAPVILDVVRMITFECLLIWSS